MHITSLTQPTQIVTLAHFTVKQAEDWLQETEK